MWQLPAGQYVDVARISDNAYLLISSDGEAQLFAPDASCLTVVPGSEIYAGLAPIEVDFDGDGINELALFDGTELVALDLQ